MTRSKTKRTHEKTSPLFQKYTWWVLGVNFGVILWGALVRATGSGAGCGGNWPLCNGQVFPPTSQIETIIEYTHRATSGMALLMVAALWVWAFRKYPAGHNIRHGATWSMVFMVTESLLGAGLVLFDWVVDNTSIVRVIVQVIHLLNTHFLLAAIMFTAWSASGKKLGPWKADRTSLTVIIGLLGILILSAAGAVTALGDTIFPAETLASGLREDFSPTAHFLIRLRVWHPILAILVGFYLLIVSRLTLLSAAQGTLLHRLSWTVIGIYGVQMLAGIINIFLLAPVWMQIIHLALADAIWIAFLLLANEKQVQAHQPG